MLLGNTLAIVNIYNLLINITPTEILKMKICSRDLKLINIITLNYSNQTMSINYICVKIANTYGRNFVHYTMYDQFINGNPTF